MGKFAKYIENEGLNTRQCCFANTSATKAPILMKFETQLHKIWNNNKHHFCKDPRTHPRTGGKNVRAHVLSCAHTCLCAWIFMKNLRIILYFHINRSIKFHKERSFCCGDICKTILTFKNHQFSMHFAYFHIFAPPKSSQMDNYWIIMNFFLNLISKCTYLMNKRTPVSAYRLFSSPSNKQIVYVNSRRTLCRRWAWEV